MIYTCAECGGTFESEAEWAEAEAQAEYSIEFPKEKAAGMEPAMVCDVCYRKLMEEHGRPGGIQ